MWGICFSVKFVSCKQKMLGVYSRVMNSSSLRFLKNPLRFHWIMFISWLFIGSSVWVLLWRSCFVNNYCSGKAWNKRFNSLMNLVLIDRSLISGLTYSVIFWSVRTSTLTSSHRVWILMDLLVEFSIIYIYVLRERYRNFNIIWKKDFGRFESFI